MTEQNQTIKLTPKQLEILYQLYRFRFLARPHIQYLLNHKEPRRINSWLKILTQHKLINRIYTRNISSYSKPAVYYLNGNAIAYIKNLPNVYVHMLSRFYKEHTRSQKYIDRCLVMADYFCMLSEIAVKNNDELTYYTKTDLEHFGFVIRPLPDACAVFKTKTGINRTLVELLPGGMPRYAILNRLEQYVEYSNSGEWEQGSGFEFPDVNLITTNRSLETFLISQIHKFNEEGIEDIRFTLMFLDQFSQLPPRPFPRFSLQT